MRWQHLFALSMVTCAITVASIQFVRWKAASNHLSHVPPTKSMPPVSAVVQLGAEGSTQGKHSDVPEDIRAWTMELDSHDVFLRFRAAKLLGEQPERAVPAIPMLLDHMTDDGAVGEEEAACTVGDLAMAALKRIGEPAFAPAVLRLRHDGDAETRAAAAQLLRTINGHRAVEPLIQALQDPAPAVRAAAVHALGLEHDSKARKPLIHLAEVETKRTVLERIPFAVVALEGDHVQDMIYLMSLDKPALRHATVGCVGQQVDDPRVVTSLLLLLRREPAAFEGWSSVFRLIRRHAGPDALVPLVKSDRYSPQIRYSAFRALENTPEERALAASLIDERVPKLRAHAARRLDALKASDMMD